MHLDRTEKRSATTSKVEVKPLKSGDPKIWNGGMMERRNITPNPKTQNCRKSPQILKRGTAENQP